jgi:hypothetical protein
VHALRPQRERDPNPELCRYRCGCGTIPHPTMTMKFNCERCANTGWLCQEHPEAPQGHRLNRGGECGGAGVPCPICNTATPPYPSNRRRHVSGEWIEG